MGFKTGLKIFVTSRERQRGLYQQKTGEILALLDKQTDAPKKRFLRNFAALLLIPDSYLLDLSPSMACALIETFYDFLELSESALAIQQLPLEHGKDSLVLIRSPDAPYLVDSIRTVLYQFAGRKRERIPFIRGAKPGKGLCQLEQPKAGPEGQPQGEGEPMPGAAIQLIAQLRLSIKRRHGKIIDLGRFGQTEPKEHFVVFKLEEADARLWQNLEQTLRKILNAALKTSQDRKALLGQLQRLQTLDPLKPWQDFLHWLKEGAFIPFAYRSFLIGEGTEEIKEARLGLPLESLYGAQIKSNPSIIGFDSPAPVIERESPLLIQQSRLISLLYRKEPLTYIGFKEPLSAATWREHAFYGLFSETALEEMAMNVPALRRKVETALAELAIGPDCHDFQRLMDVFNVFPKVELFFMSEDQLHIISRSLLTFLGRSNSVKLLILASPSPSRIALLVLIPHALFNDGKSISRIQTYLGEHLPVTLENSRLIRHPKEYQGLHLTLIPSQDEIDFDVNRLEKALSRISWPWELEFKIILERFLGKAQGNALWNKYHPGFSPEYKALIPPRFAVRDVLKLERLLASGQDVIDLWKPFRSAPDAYCRVQFYSGRASFLDEIMPFLENLNLRVVDQVQFSPTIAGKRLFIKSFSVKPAAASATSLMQLKERLLEMLTALLRGEAENDTLNGLLVLTSLAWQEIDVLRGYRNYYFQLGSPFTVSRFHQALLNNAQVALLLCRYFEARFRPNPRWSDPLLREEEGLSPILFELVAALESVRDINEDRILRTLFNLMDATVRTNFYYRRAREDYFVAFKISSLGVIDMPTPKPLYEIYVHASNMEGIHLRGGKVARGGIRWSERPDDFRTEILGLLQTQMMKNALIVPQGAKGGFIVKKAFRTPAEGSQLAKQAYITLMRGLLDLTDNRKGKTILRPPAVVAYDDDDPYLVVAADKGTAHLPDVANAVAADYRFWLGDAFASGGSNGYDHKKLGITAKGAWECAKRHFRERGQDVQRQAFTVVGIGSMDGDVFGNGMLLSPCIRLLAAFGAEHIFIDPDPDPAASYRERRRLFELPGSSWDDYDRNLISEGGGVYSRHAKDIPLSPQVRRWLKIRYHTVDGEGLIRLLLTAPVDLLWLGGIGTYIKASVEKNEEIGDRANDAVRVDASQLQAHVVGEGANLGFTQKARIEYALSGGHINTDAVDNSGGVDLSDHEVNLKILLYHLQEKNLLPPQESPHSWLEQMTEEVCKMVLADNYGQSLCLSLDLIRCGRNVVPFLDMAERLENAGLLDRTVESFPPRKEVLVRQKQSLTRPELAILMSYSKMQLYQTLQEKGHFLTAHSPQESSPLGFSQEMLQRYFPQAIRQQFAEHLKDHPLAKEITATVLCNTLINQAGSSFLTWVEDINSDLIVDAIALYFTFDAVLEGQRLREQIYRLDHAIPAQRQYTLLLQLEETLAIFCRWPLEQGKPLLPDEGTVSSYRSYLHQYERQRVQGLSGSERRQYEEQVVKLCQEGFTDSQARRLSLLDHLENFPILVDLALASSQPFDAVMPVYNAISEYLGLNKIQLLLADIPARTRWEHRVKSGLLERFKSNLARLTFHVLSTAEQEIPPFFAEHARQQKFAKYQRLQQELNTTPPANLLPFTALSEELDGLSDTCH